MYTCIFFHGWAYGGLLTGGHKYTVVATSRDAALNVKTASPEFQHLQAHRLFAKCVSFSPIKHLLIFTLIGKKKKLKASRKAFLANPIMFFPYFGISSSAFSKLEGDGTPASVNEKCRLGCKGIYCVKKLLCFSRSLRFSSGQWLKVEKFKKTHYKRIPGRLKKEKRKGFSAQMGFSHQQLQLRELMKDHLHLLAQQHGERWQNMGAGAQPDTSALPPTVPVRLGLLLRLARRLASFRGAGLQLFQLLDQQGQVLQQVPVLQQQLVDAGLSLHACRRLRCHLILQQLHLERRQKQGVLTPPRTTLMGYNVHFEEGVLVLSHNRFKLCEWHWWWNTTTTTAHWIIAWRGNFFPLLMLELTNCIIVY